MDKIVIKGARTHNLKNISLEIPRDKFVVITGLSGSGKSSLAFDTIYAEGQRRYVESLSPYARQFLGQMDKPDLDSISGLSPAIAIEQKGPGYNPRSIVGTMTEIYDYLRVLFARAGHLHCPECGIPVARQTKDEILSRLRTQFDGKKTAVLAPLVSARKGEYKELFERLKKGGFARVRVDGGIYNLEEEIKIDKNKKHSIELVVDRVEVNEANRSRLYDSVELALKESGGTVLALNTENEKELVSFSESMTCMKCGTSYGQTEPRDFSFNNPFGACPDCTGLGFKIDFDPELILPDRNISIKDGAVDVPGFRSDGWTAQMIGSFASENGFSVDLPVSKMKKKDLDLVLYGSGDREYTFKYKNEKSGTYVSFRRKFEGVIPVLERRYRDSSSEDVKREYEKYMRAYDCQACGGKRLSQKALSVKIDGKNIYDFCIMSIKELDKYLSVISLPDIDGKIAAGLLKEIRERIRFMVNVGLDYLNLFRRSDTLSGGEAQRINLATQIGAGLQGVLYVLDEPSIGLHQKDNRRLLETLLKLRNLGNTLIVVEHDEETMLSADWITDLGPGAGENGGKIVFNGLLKDLLKSEESLTAKYLTGKLKISLPSARRKPADFIEIKNARENNLKNLDIKIPLGVLCCITGVSGSGKSTLVHDILYRALAKRFYNSRELPGKHDVITGLEKIDKVINIDQSPIGRTPRSNPVTYAGVFTHIRDLFSKLPEAKAKGFMPGRFSFNVRGGRCEACQGSGVKEIRMHFLPDVYIQCDVCKGKRFDSETLEVRFKGKNIYDLLEMTVTEALALFEKIPQIKRILNTLDEVGLGYVRLGQPATTLSGGEAQRVKLATYLSKRSTGKTIYMLDEPTTGLHFADTAKLLKVLEQFVLKGNTVLVIEHNLEVVKTADYIIDLGPEGGAGGGRIIAKGAPEEVMANRASYTGKYLKEFLKRGSDN